MPSDPKAGKGATSPNVAVPDSGSRKRTRIPSLTSHVPQAALRGWANGRR